MARRVKKGDGAGNAQAQIYDLCENCQDKVTMLGKARAYRPAASVVI